MSAYVCCDCAKPIAWLNGQPYSLAEIEREHCRCDDCKRFLHHECGTESSLDHRLRCRDCDDADWDEEFAEHDAELAALMGHPRT